MWESVHKEGWAPKNCCFQIGAGEDSWKSLGSPYKEIQPIKPILKEINPEYSLKGLILKVKFQYFGHLMQKTLWERPWCRERLRAEGEGGDRGWDYWMTSLTWWTWVSANSRRQWRTGMPSMLQSMGLQRVGYNLVTKQQQQQNICNNNKYHVGQ